MPVNQSRLPKILIVDFKKHFCKNRVDKNHALKKIKSVQIIKKIDQKLIKF